MMQMIDGCEFLRPDRTMVCRQRCWRKRHRGCLPGHKLVSEALGAGGLLGLLLVTGGFLRLALAISGILRLAIVNGPRTLAISGLLRLARAATRFLDLDFGGRGTHVSCVCSARGGGGGWLLQRAAVDGDSVG